MNGTFAAYAKYYDLLYRDKEYEKEVDYIDSLLSKHLSSRGSLLELGCGTGRHAALLQEKGYIVSGVDQSGEMISQARRRLPESNFSEGDIRRIRLNKTYDAVLSLFHVISYQTSNDALKEAFATAKVHLRKGGILLFDCWYGPAVLRQRPSTRIKRLQEGGLKLTRLAEPKLEPNKNLVDVHYEIILENDKTGQFERFEELHSMRYLFKPEIEELLSQNGMELIHAEEWLSGKSPGLDTWGVCFVARA